MDENALNTAMNASMKRNNSEKSKITQKEAEQFKKAFAKKEFRDMFNDYLKEVRVWVTSDLTMQEFKHAVVSNESP